MTSPVPTTLRRADLHTPRQDRPAPPLPTFRRSAFRSTVATGLGALILCALSAVLLDRRVVELAPGQPLRIQRIARLFTDLGTSGYMLVAAALVVAFCSWRLRKSGLRQAYRERLVILGERACFFFAVVALSGIGAQAIKHLVGRARPRLSADLGLFHFDPLSVKASLASFPSGHATTAFAAATALGFFLPGWRPLLLGLAVLIALSRVAVGAHYVSDVVAGAAFGVVIALALARWFATRRFAFVLRDGRPEPLRAIGVGAPPLTTLVVGPKAAT